MEKSLSEERSRYQSLLSEHLHLEEQHRDLKEEMSLTKVWRTLWIPAALTTTRTSLRLDANHSFIVFFFLMYIECKPIRATEDKLQLQQQLIRAESEFRLH